MYNSVQKQVSITYKSLDDLFEREDNMRTILEGYLDKVEKDVKQRIVDKKILFTESNFKLVFILDIV